jgi:hypothetical protein
MNIATAQACTTATGEPVLLGAVFANPSLLTTTTSEGRAGLDAMARAVNACGGINGRPVELVYQSANNRPQAQRAAIDLLAQGVEIIVGSSTPVVSDVPNEFAAANEIVYWEVNVPLVNGSAWSFSPRPTRHQMGASAADFINRELPLLGETEIRAALIWESLPRTSELAAGVRAATGNLIIDHEYSESLTGIRQLGRDIREQHINTVYVAAYDRDALRLWYGLQDADANIAAWVQLDSDGYRRTLCNSMTVEGFISVTADGNIDPAYRRSVLGPLFREYQTIYLNEEGVAPSPTADLSASGLYLLLRKVLPAINGEITAASVRNALILLKLPPDSGMLGEGLQFTMERDSWINTHASPVIQQQQGALFCSLIPTAGATCGGGLIPFPNWYERELKLSTGLFCTGDTI